MLGVRLSELWLSPHNWIASDWLRLGLGLAALSCFGLLSLKRHQASMTWFLAIVSLMAFLPVLFPEMVQKPWRESQFTSGIERRLDAFITGVCGTAIGIVLARLASPNLFGAFDPKLLARDPCTARVRDWIGTMAVAGTLLGWQAMTTVGVLVGLIAISISCVTRLWRPALRWNEWTVWVWLSVLLYTILSPTLKKCELASEQISPVFGHILAAIGVYLLAIIWKLLQSQDSLSESFQNNQ